MHENETEEKLDLLLSEKLSSLKNTWTFENKNKAQNWFDFSVSQ